jgi:hypothetical protein
VWGCFFFFAAVSVQMEVTWEKGGSALVFHTDDAHWDAQHGDNDERTADEFNIDGFTSLDNTTGNNDGDNGDDPLGDSEGQSQNDTNIPTSHKGTQKRSRVGSKSKPSSENEPQVAWSNSGPIAFGDSSSMDPQSFALRMMQRMGWKEGTGLGKDLHGISRPLSPQGNVKTRGLGFRPGAVVSKDSDNEEDAMREIKLRRMQQLMKPIVPCISADGSFNIEDDKILHDIPRCEYIPLPHIEFEYGQTIGAGSNSRGQVAGES